MPCPEVSTPVACFSIPEKWASREQMAIELLPKRAIGIELGVQMGYFSNHLINATQPRKIVLVDAWLKNVYNCHHAIEYHMTRADPAVFLGAFSETMRMLERQVNFGNIHAVRCFESGVNEPPEWYYHTDGVDRCADVYKYLTSAAARFFPDNYFDWMFVDGNHTYEAVIEDFRNYMPKLKSGGYLLAHDFLPVWGFQVDRALQTLLSERNDLEIVGLAAGADNPTAVLRKL